jgi:hypothetical protein
LRGVFEVYGGRTRRTRIAGRVRRRERSPDGELSGVSARDDAPYPPPPRGEPHWPPQLVIAAAIALQLLLPDRLSAGPRWLLPVLEALVLLSLIVASPQRVTGIHPLRRRLALGVTILASAGNAISLALLTHYLLHHNISNGYQLIGAGSLIWLTNVLIFSLWYWEIDRGGPGTRAAGQDRLPDLLFPQMGADRYAPRWRPVFGDYLYLSLTNATAFSPTDAMPLSLTAKGIMGLQSLISLVTVGLIVSRAVNIL